MATPNDIYNEITRIDNAKQGIADAIEEKGVQVPENSKIEEYPGFVRQIQQGSSDAVLFTPQDLTPEQQAQARENIGATAPEIFWATYGVTTYAEILAAYNDGKICCVVQSGQFCHILTRVQSSVITFSCQIGTFLHRSMVSNANVWSSQNYENELASNKSQSIETDRESTSKYPSVKAVFDGLGKWGVVSQTQTWTGGASTGYDYTMSNQVWGLIPQTFIDEAKVYGAVFNENTGYFEVSGLTDVSYKEMIVINSTYATKFDFSWSGGLYYRSLPTRTIFPMNNGSYINISWSFYQNHNIESIYAPSVLYANNLRSAFGNCVHLKHIGNIVVLNLTTEANITNAFKNCRSLETCLLYNLKVSVDFGQSPRLKLDTIVYIVQNAANTTAITITLHATAYARMQADTTEYTYNGQTYVGIIAYAAARNITIASA